MHRGKLEKGEAVWMLASHPELPVDYAKWWDGDTAGEKALELVLHSHVNNCVRTSQPVCSECYAISMLRRHNLV